MTSVSPMPTGAWSRVTARPGERRPRSPKLLTRWRHTLISDMPAHMNTESRRKASTAYHAKRTADGLKKVTLWLSEAARDRLDLKREEYGSKDAAAEAAILALK